MEPNGVHEQDLDLFPIHAKPDSLRLSRIENILHHPLQIDTVSHEIMNRMDQGSKKNLPLDPKNLWPLLDLNDQQGINWSKNIIATPADDSGRLIAIEKFTIPDLKKCFAKIHQGLKEHVAGLSEEEKSFLLREASGFFLQSEEDTLLNPIEGEIRRLENDEKLHRLMSVATKLKWNGLMDAAEAAWELQAWILGNLKPSEKNRIGTLSLQQVLTALKKAAADFGNEFPIHAGTLGNDQNKVGQGIWIDPGGNDLYDIGSGNFLMVVDLSGEDIYRSQDSLAHSSNIMGIQMIADLQGNDHYLGENFAFGSTLFGYSSLFDRAGNDQYQGRCASLGFAFFGLGILQDQSGNDLYSASLMSEGFASTKGLAILWDEAGEDQYLARPTFKDDLRYSDHNIHMMQGFSSGFAPDFPGGIGLLRDGGGNDLYVADIFAQGAAYWYGLGLLIDEGGNDQYLAHQYAQGAGVHIAAGALIDFAGKDRYLSKGVSQGCGHDLGFGLLYDKEGDDQYFATDMSQGAGSANGLGILLDRNGDDRYESINPAMTLGHADMRRDRGSFGFFWDGAGKDIYPVKGKDGEAHRDSTTWQIFNGQNKGNGFGMDR